MKIREKAGEGGSFLVCSVFIVSSLASLSLLHTPDISTLTAAASIKRLPQRRIYQV